MTTPIITPVSTDQEIDRYIEFAQEVYRNNPYWLPPDPHHMHSMLTGQKEAGPHWIVQPFFAEREGRIEATITAVVDSLYEEHWKDAAGHLLFFEALPDRDDLVRQLFDQSCNWLKENGCKLARASFLYAWQTPWTIDAYDKVPTAFHTYNPPYYHSYAKNSGFRTGRGVVEFRVAFTDELKGRYQKMVSDSENTGVHLRPIDLDRAESEASLFWNLLNRTFAGHWGSPQFSEPQMQGFIDAMRPFFIKDSVCFAEVDGETAGFVFSFPDLNRAMHKLKGTPDEGSEEAFMKALGDVDHGVLLIIGVDEKFRGRGINLALAAKCYLGMIENGYRSASYTVVLDDNWPSRRTAEKLGAKIERNFVIYEKALV